MTQISSKQGRFLARLRTRMPNIEFRASRFTGQQASKQSRKEMGRDEREIASKQGSKQARKQARKQTRPAACTGGKECQLP